MRSPARVAFAVSAEGSLIGAGASSGDVEVCVTPPSKPRRTEQQDSDSD